MTTPDPPAPPTTPKFGQLPPPSPFLYLFPSPIQSHSFSSSFSFSSAPSFTSTSPSLSPTPSSLTSSHRRSAVIHPKSNHSTVEETKPGCGEIAGGTLAECAAVMCCCPCCILDLVVLTTLKLPAGLFRRAIRDRRRKIHHAIVSKKKKIMMKKKGGRHGVIKTTAIVDKINSLERSVNVEEYGNNDDDDDDYFFLEFGDPREVLRGVPAHAVVLPGFSAEDKMEEMEKEMREIFFSSGFWRSPSKKDDVDEE